MKVLHVIGKEFEEQTPEGDKFVFIDGDVYVIDNGMEIYIWIGKDCGVDEKTVGAWIANKLDNEERGGEPSVTTISEGEEPDSFKALIQFEVIDDDTPGFLRHAELDMVEYKLFRVFTKTETIEADEVFVEEVEISKSSLKSEDVFILDGNENIYMWIGNKANREEKYQGQKLMQKIDSGRSYLPLQYTIYEGENDKHEKAFLVFLEKAKGAEAVVSVEDQRELEFRPSESQTAEEHKIEASEAFADADPSSEPEKVLTSATVSDDVKDSITMSEEDITEGKDDLADAQKAEEEKLAAEKAAALEALKVAEEEERLEAEKAASDEAARKAEEERLAAEKVASEEAARKAEEERLAAEKAASEEAARKAEEERLAAEKAARKAEEERAAREKETADRMAAERAEADRLAATRSASPASGTVKLFFVEGQFVHDTSQASKSQATLEISIATEKVTLNFTGDAGLITRRTASRQAESVTKSGFLLGTGERIATGFSLEVIDADKLSDAHTRVGHSYNQ